MPPVDIKCRDLKNKSFCSEYISLANIFTFARFKILCDLEQNDCLQRENIKSIILS